MGLIHGLKSSPGEGNGNPFQYSCMGNPMDRGAWWDTVHGGCERARHALSCARSSVLDSCCSLVSSSLQPYGLPHTSLPCPPLSLRVCSKSCPLRPRCYLTISFSIILFFSCPQSFPASGSFPKSWLFASGGQSIRASASASVLPMNIQD